MKINFYATMLCLLMAYTPYSQDDIMEIDDSQVLLAITEYECDDEIINEVEISGPGFRGNVPPNTDDPNGWARDSIKSVIQMDPEHYGFKCKGCPAGLPGCTLIITDFPDVTNSGSGNNIQGNNSNDTLITIRSGQKFKIKFKCSSCELMPIHTSSEILEESVDLKVSPNPTESQTLLTFNKNDNEEYRIAIFSTSGEIVRELDPIHKEINGLVKVPVLTAGLPRGIYFVRLYNAKATLDSTRLVVK